LAGRHFLETTSADVDIRQLGANSCAGLAILNQQLGLSHTITWRYRPRCSTNYGWREPRVLSSGSWSVADPRTNVCDDFCVKRRKRRCAIRGVLGLSAWQYVFANPSATSDAINPTRSRAVDAELSVMGHRKTFSNGIRELFIQLRAGKEPLHQNSWVNFGCGRFPS